MENFYNEHDKLFVAVDCIVLVSTKASFES